MDGGNPDCADAQRLVRRGESAPARFRRRDRGGYDGAGGKARSGERYAPQQVHRCDGAGAARAGRHPDVRRVDAASLRQPSITRTLRRRKHGGRPPAQRRVADGCGRACPRLPDAGGNADSAADAGRTDPDAAASARTRDSPDGNKHEYSPNGEYRRLPRELALRPC